MSEDLVGKTLNAEIIESGFKVVTCIPNRTLSEDIIPIMIEFARGKYTDIRIVPGEVALRGSLWTLEKESHIVYAKQNERFPDYDPNAFSLAMVSVYRGDVSHRGFISLNDI